MDCSHAWRRVGQGWNRACAPHRNCDSGKVSGVPFPARSYLMYVDDSGNEQVGILWVALAIPFEFWSEYLRRWLGFRQNLYAKMGVPASYELHAQVWLSPDPMKDADEHQRMALASLDPPEVLNRNKFMRRERSRWYEKGLQTVGTFTEARLLTVCCPEHSGVAKLARYDDLLCFTEQVLATENAHATLIVDGAMDGGGHLRSSHRALRIQRRRIIEDAAHRRSAESQLLQMVDFCAHAAFQSLQRTRDEKFSDAYENRLARLIQRPFGVDDGRCIRGHDYEATHTHCPSNRCSAGS